MLNYYHCYYLKVEFKIITICSLRRELCTMGTLKWPGRNRVQITCNTSSVYHMEHVVCHVALRDSSAFKFYRVLNQIYLNFISLAETIYR